MPFIWTEPNCVISHQGVNVYNTYKDGFADQTSQYWYTLVQSDDDWEGPAAFDIRDLDAYAATDSADHVEILKAAIESGELGETCEGNDGVERSIHAWRPDGPIFSCIHCDVEKEN